MAGSWAVAKLIMESKKGKEAKMTTEGAVKREIGREVVLRREGLLAVLRRAATESEFLARLAENPHEALKEYYTLTSEERAALASGDIKKIESWVGKLNKELATWLWCRLSQEKWYSE